MSTAPPPGFSSRPARIDDRDAIAELVNEVNVTETGVAWTTPDEIADGLMSPGHRPGDDVVLVADDGSLAGYLTVTVDDPLTMIHQLAFVRPDLWGRGLSTFLLRLGEAHARERFDDEPAASVHLRVARWTQIAAAVPLFESLRYRPARIYHQMRIELDDGSDDAVVPDGIEIRTFRRGRDERAVHRALVEAFEDHWGASFGPFDVWLHGQIDGAGANFDPGFWFLALDGDEVVGVAYCRDSTPSDPDAAHVDDLGVRRAWRGRGIARALLLTAFGEARRRRIGAMDLAVDSENWTGATRLDESVGMRTFRSDEQWEKLLSAGAR
jgi:mycothiol synthase